MIEIGRLCVKIAGRDAGKKGVIIDVLDDRYVLLDGEVRRRRCNILHLEPLSQAVKLEKDATHGDVIRAMKDLGIEPRQSKPKPKTQRPKAKRKTAEQLRTQRVEKKKLRDIFRPKKKEEKGTALEEKAAEKVPKEEKPKAKPAKKETPKKPKGEKKE